MQNCSKQCGPLLVLCKGVMHSLTHCCAWLREKELLRALAAQERQATRRHRDVNTGPKDDLDIEWEQLMEAHHQAG